MSGPSKIPREPFLLLGALSTALVLSLLGLWLSSWAHAFATHLFEPGATVPSARDVVEGGPGPLASLIPFWLVALVHLGVLPLTAKMAPVSRALTVVGASAAGVLGTALAFGHERPVPVIAALALALSCAAAAGYGVSWLTFRVRAWFRS